jgi:AraC-like DNA-binding protein
VDKAVFNIHDVILIMTAMQCLFFALFLLLTKKSPSDIYLAAFLIVLAFVPIHELIMWGSVFKLTVRDNFPDIYFIAGFAYYIDTVLLLFYIKSLAFDDFKLSLADLKHFLPLLLFVIYMVVFFYARPHSERLDMINNESFAYSQTYIAMDLFCKLLRVINCVICLVTIHSYKNILQSTHSKVETVSLSWLNILLFGFITVTLLELALSFAKAIGSFTGFNINLFEFLGLTGYYVLFIVVNLLIFSSIRLFAAFSQVSQVEKSKPYGDESDNCEQYVGAIGALMDTQKYFLIPDITLDALAREMAISPRNFSLTLNRHFNKNFYEFINEYRVNEAKERLIDPVNSKKTITDIYLEVGFNSKSVFNTFFKKLVGLTPSQYRKNQLLQ